MKVQVVTALMVILQGCVMASDIDANANHKASATKTHSVLTKQKWIHGSADCQTNGAVSLDVYRHDQTSLILRQNKCLTFEAPFIYVLIGASKILVLDTGALDGTDGFSLYREIKSAIGEKNVANKQMLVVHSHAHSDHYQGDEQFIGQPNVTMIKPTAKDLMHYFGFNQWPSGQSTIDLGGRMLTVIPTPGHQEEAITLYDQQNKWLLTGDTLYPGLIYVKNWHDYKNSIARLNEFATSHEIAAILGAHIEATDKPGEFYPIGTTYQPNEAQLDLAVRHLTELNSALQQSPGAEKIVFDEFTIEPMGLLQKTISNIARWFTQ